jgi:hypothetical protein
VRQLPSARIEQARQHQVDRAVDRHAAQFAADPARIDVLVAQRLASGLREAAHAGQVSEPYFDQLDRRVGIADQPAAFGRDGDDVDPLLARGRGTAATASPRGAFLVRAAAASASASGAAESEGGSGERLDIGDSFASREG